jgi:hypothetical protein
VFCSTIIVVVYVESFMAIANRMVIDAFSYHANNVLNFSRFFMIFF